MSRSTQRQLRALDLLAVEYVDRVEVYAIDPSRSVEDSAILTGFVFPDVDGVGFDAFRLSDYREAEGLDFVHAAAWTLPQ